jgi:hypothetical protein
MRTSSHKPPHGCWPLISLTLCFVVIALLTSTPFISPDQDRDGKAVPEILIGRMRINWLSSKLNNQLLQFIPAAPVEAAATSIEQDFAPAALEPAGMRSALKMFQALRC